MIHSVVMDKRFTITVGYFLTCAICKQRVLHSDSNSANTKSWSIPEARCKKCMDLIEKAINVKQKKRNEEHYVELLCYTFIMLEFFVQRFYQISFLLNTRLTRLAVNNHTKNDWELIFFWKIVSCTQLQNHCNTTKANWILKTMILLIFSSYDLECKITWTMI